MTRSTRTISITRWIKPGLIAAALALFAIACISKQGGDGFVLTNSEKTDMVPVRASQSDFGKFNHSVPEHQKFDCKSCHVNSGEKEIRFAGHESCVGCHLNQFTEQKGLMCAICHTDVKSSNPPVVAFPAKFSDEPFNMKFDHAAHTKGDALPKEGCDSCHQPMGPGKKIPVGIEAHQNCMTCHTPESKIGSCSVCHEMKPYERTPQSRYVFRAVFSHADHGPRQKVTCAECHTVKEDAPQSKQVSNILAKQHRVAKANTCYSCHDGVRAFGGNSPNEFQNCRRCHTGGGFDMLPDN